MDRNDTTLIEEPGRVLSARVPASHSITAAGIVAAFATLVALISVAPAVVGLAAAVAVAIGWCIWLDGHPDGRRL
jgi:hypothetical protein